MFNVKKINKNWKLARNNAFRKISVSNGSKSLWMKDNPQDLRSYGIIEIDGYDHGIIVISSADSPRGSEFMDLRQAHSDSFLTMAPTPANSHL